MILIELKGIIFDQRWKRKMEEFVHVCSLLECYLTQKQKNNKIWAMLNMKENSKIIFSRLNLKYQAADSPSQQSKVAFPLYDRPCLQSCSDSQASVSIAEHMKKQEGDEFEDMVLKKLEFIEMKLALLKQCKRAHSQTVKIIEDEPEKQSSQTPLPELKYIPLNKIMRKNKGNGHYHGMIADYPKIGRDELYSGHSRKTSSQLESEIESRKQEDISADSLSQGIEVRTKSSRVCTKRHSYSNSEICRGTPEYSLQDCQSQMFQQNFPVLTHRRLNSHLNSRKNLNRTLLQPNMKKQKRHTNISLRQ